MSETKFKKVTHCIFDMDGLLLDTERLYTDATQKILNMFGDQVYTFDVKLSLMGMVHMDMCRKIVDAYKLPITPEEYSKLQKQINSEIMINAQLMPGAERLLRHLHKHNIPFCLATSSGQDMVEIKITHHQEIFKLFHHRVCGSTDPDVKQGKPAPDIFLVAASRFPDKPDPSQCLVFEDAPNGVKGAHSAGMQVVMVPDERVPLEMCALATQRILSLEQFQPELFGLPPFDN
ncbi:probable pseudouridine-5'-phosphatase isoform X1 [Musca vetustissima]|uniref:probable pseudouridine-5'-phosphatase isoform X1 n=1 Tax=Musca vetustissima TaxID=27455 RepID=UPI002AB73AFD|nr:probable pseudouridine-5'-phosphatase isoform X1 [Musca vetustissima]